MQRIDISRKLRALLATTTLAIGIAVAPLPLVPAAEANDEMLPDLTVQIMPDHFDAKYQPGAAVGIRFEITNNGWTATYPYVNMLIPKAFTNVSVAPNGMGTCAVKPPTASIPGHYITCEAIQGIVNGEFPGILPPWQPRDIRVSAAAPRDPGQYNITAGIGDLEGKEKATHNNNAAQMVIVTAPVVEIIQKPSRGTCVLIRSC